MVCWLVWVLFMLWGCGLLVIDFVLGFEFGYAGCGGISFLLLASLALVCWVWVLCFR